MSHKRGFTLVELLVVIGIIGVLASIIIGSLSGAKASARDARRISDVKNIQIALAEYYNDNGHYPCQIYGNGGSSNYTTPGGVCYPGFYQSIYMSNTPVDPRDNSTHYAYSALNANNSTNCISAATNIVSYHLGAALETTNVSFLSGDKDETDTQETANNYKGCSESSAVFNGNSVNAQATICSGTNNTSPDPCYDVTPDI